MLAIDFLFSWWSVLVIIISALAAFAFGGVWYAPKVFGNRWMDEVGMNHTDHKAGSSKAKGMALMQLAMLMQAIFLAVIINPQVTAVIGAIVGVFVALGFVSTAIVVNVIAERRSIAFFLINAGFSVISFALMGGILGWLL